MDMTRAQAIDWCRTHNVKFISPLPFPPPSGWLWCDPAPDSDDLYSLEPMFTITDQGDAITYAEVWGQKPIAEAPPAPPATPVPEYMSCCHVHLSGQAARCFHPDVPMYGLRRPECILQVPKSDPRVPRGCVLLRKRV